MHYISQVDELRGLLDIRPSLNVELSHSLFDIIYRQYDIIQDNMVQRTIEPTVKSYFQLYTCNTFS